MIYLFPDIETTGLDPDSDHILEIAWQITDANFNTLTPLRSYIVEQDDWAATWNRLTFAPLVVREMHQKSGLTRDLTDSRDENFRALHRIQKEIERDIDDARQTSDEPVHLAGMSVGFDRDFMKAQGIDLFDGPRAIVHHRILDISSIKLMLSSSGIDYMKAENLNPHRAFSDVLEGIRQASIFAGMFRHLSHPDVPEAGA